MYSSNSAQLIQNILSNPVLANQCVDYIQNIKPKLSILLTKIPILEELENKLSKQEELSKSSELDKPDNEYKELLIKLKLKYENLKKEYKTVQNQNNILQYNLSNNNSKEQACEECNKKNDIIKQFTLHINKPCHLCEEKDRQIHKLFQKNDKICKEKDDQINELKSRCIILQKQAFDSANELARLQSLNTSQVEQKINTPEPEQNIEPTKQKIDTVEPVQKINAPEVKQKIDTVEPAEKLDNPEQNLNTSNKNVLEQLKEQFGNFVKINNSN